MPPFCVGGGPVSSSHDARGSSGAACALIALSALVLLPLSASIGLRTEATPRTAIWSQPYELTILHTNDLHGQVLPRQGTGGLLELGRRIRIEREAALRAGRGVLLLDAGDIFKGTLEGDLTDGAVVVDWMNLHDGAFLSKISRPCHLKAVTIRGVR